MTLQEALAAINALGVTGLLVVILYGGQKGWWVFGWTYRDLKTEVDEWRALARNGTSLAENSVSELSKRIVAQLEQDKDQHEQPRRRREP